jgi:hypothetical protein
VELLFHRKGGSASFGAKMPLSLNGVDLSCMNSITGSTCRAKYSNILDDTSGMVSYHADLKKHIDDLIPNNDFPVLYSTGIVSLVSGIISYYHGKYRLKNS